MEYLITLAEEFGLRQIVGRALENSSVQGVVVDIDPFWLSAWQAYVSGQEYRRDEWFYRYWRHGRRPPIGALFRPATQSDLSWRPEFWSEFNEHFSGIQEDTPPLIVKVCLEPTAEFPTDPNFGSDRLRVVFEYRPLARLASVPKDLVRPLVGGLSVGTAFQPPGTLGGTLRDNNGKSFALTCGHVLPKNVPADQPALSDSAKGTFIGNVAFATVLDPTPAGGICNPYNPASVMNEVDVAVIELDQTIGTKNEVLEIGPISGITPKALMSPGITVETTGRSSKHRILQVGGIAATYNYYDSSGTEYCFKNLFELRWPSDSRLALGRPISGGDSGAWVCAQGKTGTEWCGMVIGEDRLMGYAAFSENIMDLLRVNHYNLSL